MAQSWSVILVFLFAALLQSHSAESGAPQGKRRQTTTAGTKTLQRPLQDLQNHRSNRDRGGSRGPDSLSAEAGPGLLSQSNPHPLVMPEEDGKGVEILSPVRVETNPDTYRVQMSTCMKSPHQAQENGLVGPRKGRGHGHGNGHEHRRHDKGWYGKGKSTGADKHSRHPLSSQQIMQNWRYVLLLVKKWNGMNAGSLSN